MFGIGKPELIIILVIFIFLILVATAFVTILLLLLKKFGVIGSAPKRSEMLCAKCGAKIAGDDIK
jgi:hypothetical protein